MRRHSNSGRRSHAAWGVGTSGRVWRGTGSGEAQVGGTSHRERMWVAGKTTGLWILKAAYEEAVGEREGNGQYINEIRKRWGGRTS